MDILFGCSVQREEGTIHLQTGREGWRSERYSEWHPSTVVEVRGAMSSRGWTTELWWEAR